LASWSGFMASRTARTSSTSDSPTVYSDAASSTSRRRAWSLAASASASRSRSWKTSTPRSRILAHELVVLVLGALDPQHVVEQQLVVVGGGQPLEAELGPMDHHLAQPTNLGMHPEAPHRPSIPPTRRSRALDRVSAPDPAARRSPGPGRFLGTGRLSPVRAASSISRVAAHRSARRPGPGCPPPSAPRRPAPARWRRPPAPGRRGGPGRCPSSSGPGLDALLRLGLLPQPDDRVEHRQPSQHHRGPHSPVTSRLMMAAASRTSCMPSRSGARTPGSPTPSWDIDQG
jgi:hypothetical protein